MSVADVLSKEIPVEQDHERGACQSAQDQALRQLAQTLKQVGYRFTTVTPATHARVNQRPANAWAASIEGVFGWSRPFRTGLLPASLFALMQAAGVIVRHEDGWRSMIRLSTLHDQIFIHSAYPTIGSDAVFFGPDTYRFISALEHHLANRMHPVRRAVDIGCGAGPGAIIVALHHPAAEVIAADINDAALRLTAINASLAATSNVVPLHSNLLAGVVGEFDLIVANPPYLLDAGERAYRHGGGDLGEGLSVAIIKEAMSRLAPGGSLLLYTGVAIVDGVDYFRENIAPLLSHAGFTWEYREIDPDVFGEELLEPAYAQTDRIASVLVTVTRGY